MSGTTDMTEAAGARAGDFTTTHWSVVAAAGGSLAGAAAALEQVCGGYWYPVYAFIRRRGSDHHQAEDLTQAFFARLLEKETLKQADRTRGKFRTFLLAALTNFLANEWDKQQAFKRGGQRKLISLDETVAEDRYRQEPVEALIPEKLFERHWALALLEQVLGRLKQDYVTAGKQQFSFWVRPAV